MSDSLAHPPTAPQPVLRAAYRPPDWFVRHVALEFDLDPERTLVRATLTVERNGDHDRPLVLDGQDLETLDVRVDGAPTNARPDGETLTLPIAAARATVETRVAINPRANTRLAGLYASSGLLCTQCEAEGFRRITWFPDRPDVLATYTVRLAADRARFPILLSNGDPVAHGDLSEGRHFAEWRDPWPKPSYLFALVAGDLAPRRDAFTTASGRPVELAIWTAAADVPRSAHAMAALKAAMRWDEVNYGREYDLDVFNIVAVADFNAGAMENKGLNIFNSKYILADPDTATDQDYDAIAAVVAHEYFHNWTGNRVTCRDWFQLSLKEGLTVFRDQQFSADQGSPAVERIDDVRALRLGQFPEDAGPHAHPIRPDSYLEIGNFYTATVYNKGAEVIRMLHTLLGPAGYRAGADLYFDRHDGEAATCDDWLAAMADATGRDLSLFARWYSQAGTPRVGAAVTARDGGLDVTLRQTTPPTPGQPFKPPLHLPQRIALFDRAGARLGDERLVELTAAETTVRFDAAPADAVLSLNRGFTAPVIVEIGHDRPTLAFLSAHDDDPFARYDALQRLALATLTTDCPADDLVEAIAATLASDLDPAFVAEAVLLPTEAFVGEQLPVIDPDAIHARREAVRAAIAERLRDRFAALHRDLAADACELTPAAKARRRLRNVALGWLAVADHPAGLAAAAAQFDAADNMTDRYAALAVLANGDSPERGRALAAFHARHAADPNVIDKWFGVQALSFRPDTLATVRALRARPDYNPANPNRVRSLLGAFGANQLRFNAADGAGYRFLAEEVLALDAANPSTAARMIAPLTRWRRFEPGRAALMKSELERLAGTQHLSRDTFEMATKALA